jgi:enamine deaminase RidA (YjgF/YER057c/UK114 family)
MPRSERLRLGARPGWLVLVGLAALAVSSGAGAQARTETTVLMAINERARADQEQYGYADAVIAGDLIFLSGIVLGKAPEETDLPPAFERVFRQIGRILERAGASDGDIVDITSFHTDITSETGTMCEVSKRLLSSPPRAWTAVQVERLLPDEGIAEIKNVARRPAAAKTQ